MSRHWTLSWPCRKRSFQLCPVAVHHANEHATAAGPRRPKVAHYFLVAFLWTVGNMRPLVLNDGNPAIVQLDDEIREEPPRRQRQTESAGALMHEVANPPSYVTVIVYSL